MQRKTLNLVLGGVAIALLAVIVLRKQHEAAKADADRNGAPATTLVASAIQHITLQHAGAPDIALERAGTQWRLTAPVAAEADPVAVDRLLKLATGPTRATLEPAAVKRGELGLEPPAATLKLDTTTLTIGGLEPIRFTRYVEVDAGAPGDKIVLLDDPGDAVFGADYSGLVAKNLLPIGAEIRSITLPGLHVARSDHGWRAEPAGASADALQAFVARWRTVQSIANEAMPAADAAGDGSVITIELTDGQMRVYRIVSRSEELVLDDPALRVRYHMPAAALDQLLQLPKPAPDAAPVGDATPK